MRSFNIIGITTEHTETQLFVGTFQFELIILIISIQRYCLISSSNSVNFFVFEIKKNKRYYENIFFKNVCIISQKL